MIWMIFPMALVLVLGVSYAVASCQIGRKAAIKRLPLGIFVIGAAGGTVALLEQLPGNWSDVGLSGFFLLGAFCAWLVLGRYIGKVARAGSVLLNIGRPRDGLIIGTTVFVCGLLAGILFIAQMPDSSEASMARGIRQFSSAILAFSAGISLGVIWSKKSSIRTGGIVTPGQFIEWDKIERVEWQKDKPFALVLKVRRLLPFWPSVLVSVPAEKRDAVTEILQRYLPLNAEDPGSIA